MNLLIVDDQILSVLPHRHPIRNKGHADAKPLKLREHPRLKNDLELIEEDNGGRYFSGYPIVARQGVALVVHRDELCYNDTGTYEPCVLVNNEWHCPNVKKVETAADDRQPEFTYWEHGSMPWFRFRGGTYEERCIYDLRNGIYKVSEYAIPGAIINVVIRDGRCIAKHAGATNKWTEFSTTDDLLDCLGIYALKTLNGEYIKHSKGQNYRYSKPCDEYPDLENISPARKPGQVLNTLKDGTRIWVTPGLL